MFRCFLFSVHFFKGETKIKFAYFKSQTVATLITVYRTFFSNFSTTYSFQLVECYKKNADFAIKEQTCNICIKYGLIV